MATIFKRIGDVPNQEYVAEKAKAMVANAKDGATISGEITDVESGPQLATILVGFVENVIGVVRMREADGLPTPRVAILISIEYAPRPGDAPPDGIPA